MLRTGSGGEESLQQRLMPGDIFCPAAMVSGQGCGSYAVSLESCQLLSWSHRWFNRLMEQDGQLRKNLMLLLARHVEEERHKRCLLQCVNVRAKVASFLLARINQNDNDLSAVPETIDEIDLRPISLTAQELGMARETMSRAFSTFEQDGILYCRRGLIRVRDCSRLQMIVDGGDGCCCQRAGL